MKSTNRFVVDTNILISAMLFPCSVPALALKKVFDIGMVVISKECADELTLVVMDEKFEKYVPFSMRQAFLLDFEDAVVFVNVKNKIAVCRDLKDDKYLSLAVSAKAKFIITGDNDLLILNPFKNISIITPAEFLKKF
ncbi:MAG: putative toxin-antitoxin system toxin component, PIN family [Bacteroidales bacterium]